MMKSITSVYKIGNGPSSSHTVGPYHAAQTFGSRYPDADSYEVTLFGSLAFTGEGHGTGKAILEGLPGAKIIFDHETKEKDLPHPNTMLFKAFKDGNEIASETVFRPKAPSGTVDVTFTFSGNAAFSFGR